MTGRHSSCRTTSNHAQGHRVGCPDQREGSLRLSETGVQPGRHSSIYVRLAGWFWRKTKPGGHETESLTWRAWLSEIARESKALGRRLQTGHRRHTSKFWAVEVGGQNQRGGLLGRAARHRPCKPEQQETSVGIYWSSGTAAWSPTLSAQ